jgi:hypothetical protein
MTKDEILLFKQWDSDPTPSRTRRHPPTHQPVNPSKSAQCCFPDHEPNTCPEVPDAVDEAAKRLIDVVKLVPSWPPVGQLYTLLFGIMPGGAKMLTKRLVKDERGHFGPSSMSEAQKAEILSRMMKSHKEGGMESCAAGLYV